MLVGRVPVRGARRLVRDDRTVVGVLEPLAVGPALVLAPRPGTPGRSAAPRPASRPVRDRPRAATSPSAPATRSAVIFRSEKSRLNWDSAVGRGRVDGRAPDQNVGGRVVADAQRVMTDVVAAVAELRKVLVARSGRTGPRRPVRRRRRAARRRTPAGRCRSDRASSAAATQTSRAARTTSGQRRMTRPLTRMPVGINGSR